jgi:hypothetical protein
VETVEVVGQEEIAAVVLVAVGNGKETVASRPSILEPLSMKRIMEKEGQAVAVSAWHETHDAR